MDKETIQTAIENGPEAVEKLIQSETDRRVQQARDTWESEIPEKVDAEIERRAEHEKQMAAKRTEISQEIGARFEGTKVDPETWGAMIDVDGLLALEGDERTEAIDREAQRVTGLVDRVLKSQYSGKAPVRGEERTMTSQDVARVALGLTD